MSVIISYCEVTKYLQFTFTGPEGDPRQEYNALNFICDLHDIKAIAYGNLYMHVPASALISSYSSFNSFLRSLQIHIASYSDTPLSPRLLGGAKPSPVNIQFMNNGAPLAGAGMDAGLANPDGLSPQVSAWLGQPSNNSPTKGNR